MTAGPQGVPRTCNMCGTAAPAMLRWFDRSIVDYWSRVMLGYPGPTAQVVVYCDTAGCLQAVEAKYGPAGNVAALHRLTDEIAAKHLSADDNEVRLLALAVKLGPNPTPVPGLVPGLVSSPHGMFRITGLT